MPKLALLDDYLDVGLKYADWTKLPAGWTVERFVKGIGGEDALAATLADFDAIMLMRERTPFPGSLLKRLPKLKLLITSGKRNASIDVATAKAQGIVVCGTDSLGFPPAELAWGLILALARGIVREDASLRAGTWQTRAGVGLKGKTLGLFGLGRLGSLMAPVGKAFGMEVLGWSRSLTPEKAAAVGAVSVDKDEIFRRSDFVVVLLVLNAATRGLVGARELGLMKPSAFLVNIARGPIVDETALTLALREGRIAGAGLDVYDQEPIPDNHPFLSLDNTVLLPHLGYVTEENHRIHYQSTLDAVQAWLAGKPINVIED